MARIASGATQLTATAKIRKRSGGRRSASGRRSAWIKRPPRACGRAVARPPHRHDFEVDLSGELLAQPPDMYVDCLAVPVELGAPHALQQRLPGMHAIGVRDEV